MVSQEPKASEVSVSVNSRPALVAATLPEHLGAVFFNLPLPYRWFSLGIGSFMLLLLLGAIFLDYADTLDFRGYIEPNQSLVHIYPERRGVLRAAHVHQGQWVKKGALLFDLNAAQYGAARGLLIQEQRQALEQQLLEKQQQLEVLKPLLKAHYISMQEYRQAEEAWQNSRTRLQGLQSSNLDYQDQHSYRILAPVSGYVASLPPLVGQHIDPAKPLLKMVPEGSSLQAVVFIPVTKAGQIKSGTVLSLEYDAFPSARFGRFLATVREISQTSTLAKDDNWPISNSEPYYIAKAELRQQTLRLWDREYSLQLGMGFKAFAAGERHPIWRWMLGPFFAKPTGGSYVA